MKFHHDRSKYDYKNPIYEPSSGLLWNPQILPNLRENPQSQNNQLNQIEEEPCNSANEIKLNVVLMR